MALQALIGSIFIGDKNVTNVGKMVENAVVDEALSITNEALSDPQSTNIISFNNDGNVNIDHINQSNSVTVHLKSVFQSMQQQSSDESLLQNLDQQAKAMMSGFVGIGSENASNYMSQTMQSAMNLASSTVNRCVAQSTSTNDIEYNNNGNVSGMTIDQGNLSNLVSSCTANVSQNQNATLTMDQRGKQAAQTGSEIPLSIILAAVVGVVVLIVVMQGADGKSSFRLYAAGLIAAVAIIITVCLYMQVGGWTWGYDMVYYAYSTLLENTGCVRPSKAGSFNRSADEAAAECLKDPESWAVDYKCWDVKSRDTRHILTTLYTTQPTSICLENLTCKTDTCSPKSYNETTKKAKSKEELQAETNYTIVKRFKDYIWVILGLVLFGCGVLGFSGFGKMP
jgi:hypothetical protein